MSRLLIFPKEHICILTGAFREDGTAVRTKSLRGELACEVQAAGSARRGRGGPGGGLPPPRPPLADARRGH